MKKGYLFILISLFGFVTVLTFQNCGVKRPGVDSAEFMSTSFTHKGTEASCVQCHTRPTDKTGFTSFNAYAPYDYNNHGAKLDCISCHGNMPNLNRNTSDWAKGYFTHNSTLKTCTECHSSQRPNTLMTGSAHPATGDCLSCHAGSLTLVQDKPASFHSSMDVKTMWKTSSAKPTFLVNDPATDVTTFVSSATYSANGVFTGWSTGSPNLQKLKMQMNHQAVIVGVDLNSCFSCHTSGNDYSKSRFHSMVLAQPTSCSSCHDDMNVNNVPRPFITGKNDAFVGPATGINVATNPTLFNHNVSSATADCASCHKQTNWSALTWKNGIFHKGDNTTPAACVECHNPNRPVGITSGGFDHATMNGMGECATCHNAALTAVKTKTALNTSNKLTVADWKGASSTPTGMAGTKSLTVAALKYNSNAGVIISKTASTQSLTLQINHSLYQTNCTSCHGSSTDMKMGIFHAAMSAQPTTCKGCHSTALGGFVLGVAAMKPLDHNHINVNGKDCATCHSAPTASAKLINFKDGVFHSKLTVAPSSCKECHSIKILDQPVWGVKDHSTIGAVDCLGCHTPTGTGTVTAPNWKGSSGAPSGIAGSKSLTVASVKFNSDITGAIVSKTASTQSFILKIDHTPFQTNCTQCHSGSNDPKMGIFHAAMSTQPTTCKNCHSTALNGFVLGYSALKPLDHNHASVTAKDCLSCHATPTASAKLINFKDGVFHSKLTVAPTSCKECHSGKVLDQPVWGAKDHSTIGTMDCLSCHTSTGTGGTVTAPTWKGGSAGAPSGLAGSKILAVASVKFNSNTAGAIISKTASTQNFTLKIDHSLYQTNCSQCHSSSTDMKLGIFHAAMSTQPTTCKGCHSTALNGFVLGASATKPLDHNHASVSAKDCLSCHATPTASVKLINFKDGVFHSKLTVAPTSCKECHSGKILDQPIWGTKDHSTIGSADCISCHTATGTGGSLAAPTWNRLPSAPTGIAGTKLLAVASVKFNKDTAGAIISKTASTQNFTLKIDHSLYQTNCTSCHGSSGDAKMGVFHSALLTQPTTCKNCHSTALNGFVLGYSALKPLDHNHASVTAKDCLSCHATPTASLKSINFKDGVFHSKLTVAPTSCKECHSGKVLDQPVWGTKNHSTIGSSDCLGCHTSAGTGTVTAPNWKGAKATPSTYTIASHIVGSSILGYTAPHTQTNVSCTSCHGTSTTYKTITSFDHQGLPAGNNTCISCHLGTITSVAAYIAPGSRIKVKGTDSRHHASSLFTSKGVSCVGCHTMTAGSTTFNTANGIVFPSSAKQAYINIGCGSVNPTTFSCHHDGQQKITIPTTPSGTAGSW